MEGVVKIGMIAGIVVRGIVSNSGSSDWAQADRVRSRRARDEWSAISDSGSCTWSCKRDGER